ncbi:MAG: glycogen debranching N-terminal domain-containing protein [Acetobacteraceae bacterium]|nr:glycogen debranching N-terminal domain-containing protein [Acetobacteraceae bacterium]
MTVEITVGPPQLAIHQGYTVLITEPDGQITWSTDKGLYFFDTRVVSGYAVYANGAAWDLLNSGAPAHFGAKVFLTNKAFPSEGGDVAAHTLSLVLTRIIDGGMHERFEITNHGRNPVDFNLELALRSDFSDIFEVKSGRIVRRGRISTTWSDDRGELTTAYHNGTFSRAVCIRVQAPSPAIYANGRLSFTLKLSPGETWSGSLLYDLMDGERRYPAPETAELQAESPQGRALREWRDCCLKIETSAPGICKLFDQAVEDMAALRLPVEAGDTVQYVPAAGLPWFVALFGRDPLIVSLQTMILNPAFARATLAVLGAWQALETDPYRDAEPGKILHELRRGELAALKLIPHTPYYGTADATPLFLVVLHALWRTTGDRAEIEAHLATAEGCLSWIDDYGDRDGDGFQEYGTRSGDGYENVGWKDSGEAVVDVDGSNVSKPKALCELQGYVYAAWRGMAEIYAALGDDARAARLTEKADALFARFNAVFWNEAEGFYAYCLDGAKKPIWTVASNPGHLLWSGIVPPDRAARVVDRLLQPDMWSGWGIRTLTANNPTFNPYSYQNGSVWPHDNSLIALGFKRYGFGDQANRVAGDIAEAASYFAQRQLPELYSGMRREAASFPVQYLGANVPQAWAAGAVFALLQAMLGIEFDAPNQFLTLDPALPSWLPDITLRGLRMGADTFDIAFQRDETGTHVTVLRGPAGRIRLKSAPASLVAT